MIRIRKIIAALVILQAWAVLFALLIEKTIEKVSDMRGLSDMETIAILFLIWSLMGLIIFIFYNDLTFLKSLEGIIDRVIPKEEVEKFQKVWKKVNNNGELTEEDKATLFSFEEKGFLKKGFTDEHINKKWSPMEALRFRAVMWVMAAVIFLWIDKQKNDEPQNL